MKRVIWLLLAVLLLAGAVVCGTAEGGFEEEEIDIEDLEALPETVDTGDPLWDFPVALEDMNPEYIRLANKHYLLPEDYVPDDLVKVPKDPKKGGIKWKSAPSEGHQLQAECAEALCAMNQAIRDDAPEFGYTDLYLKSAYRSYSTQKTMYRNRLKKRRIIRLKRILRFQICRNHDRGEDHEGRTYKTE